MTNIPSVSTDVKNISPLNPTQCPTANTSQAERIDAIREEAIAITPLPNAPLAPARVSVPVVEERGRQAECRAVCVSLFGVCAIIALGVGGYYVYPWLLKMGEASP